MSLFGTVNMVLKTQAPGDYVKGKWVPGEPGEPVPFEGTVQPPSGETMRLFPEGTRKSDVIEVIAPRDIVFNVADTDKQVPSSVIEWDEKDYEVVGAVLMDNGLIPHWEVIARRKKEGAA